MLPPFTFQSISDSDTSSNPPSNPSSIWPQSESMRNDEPKSDTPRKPLKAFFLFSRAKRSQAERENPTLTSEQITEFLGEKWKDLPEEQKIPYKTEAKKILEKFKVQHPNNYSDRKHPKNAYFEPIITEQQQLNLTILQTKNYPKKVKVNYRDTPRLILEKNPELLPSKHSYSNFSFFHNFIHLSPNQSLLSQGINNNATLILIFSRNKYKETGKRETTIKERLILIPYIEEYSKADMEKMRNLRMRIAQDL